MHNPTLRPPFLRSRRGAALTVILGILGVLLLLALAIGAYFVSIYNRGNSLQEAVDAQWANVDVVLQRRYDLIPNLVNTVKGFATQERELLTEVTRLRSQWGEAQSVQQRAAVAGELEGALARLMVVVENYPQLRSNENFLSLQSQLEGTENRVAVERRRYNESLQAYNSFARKIPGTLLFDPREAYFEAAESAQTAPTVQF